MPRRPEQTEGLLSASGMRHGIHGTPSRSKSMMIDTLVAWGILIKSVFLSRNRIVVSKPMARRMASLGASRGYAIQRKFLSVRAIGQHCSGRAGDALGVRRQHRRHIAHHK